MAKVVLLLLAAIFGLNGCYSSNPMENKCPPNSCLVHMVATKNSHGDYEIYLNEEKFITLVSDFDGRFIVH